MLTDEEIAEGVLNMLSELIPIQEEIRLSAIEEVRLEADIVEVLKRHFQGVGVNGGALKHREGMIERKIQHQCLLVRTRFLEDAERVCIQIRQNFKDAAF